MLRFRRKRVSAAVREDNAVGVFQFDEKKGQLKQIQMIDEFAIDGRDEQVVFKGGNEITVSPDGRNAYAVATSSGALAAFERDVKTGMLKLIDMIGDEELVGGAAGITVSPDGGFVAVAAEERQTVSIFRRPKKTNEDKSAD